MLLPGGGLNWKAAKAQMPPSRVLRSNLTRSRLLLLICVTGIVMLLYRAFRAPPPGPQNVRCWGPNKSPMEMTPNEHALWNAHMQTPVLFNHHKPLKVESPSIQHIDLNPITSSPQALIRNERVLILTPLKDAAPFLKNYFKLIAELTYPHRLIDLAFLISDSKDDTLAVLASELDHLQKRKDEVPFNSITVVEKNFHFHLSQDAEQRHGFEVQAPRRKAMAKARNYLLATALKPEHSWVYWRDVDIEQAPRRIIEDFVAHDRDILVPSKSLKDILRHHGTDTSETFGSIGSRRVLISKVDLTTTHGSSPTKAESSRTACRRTQSLSKATRNSTLGANTCVRWGIGAKTKMLRFNWMVLVVSTFWSRQTFIDQASTFQRMPSRTRPRPRALPRWLSVPAIKLLVSQTTSYGITIHKRRVVTYDESRILESKWS